MKKFLARYGVDLGDNLVIESNPIGQLFGIGPEVPIVQQYEPHPITRDMGGHHHAVSPHAQRVAAKTPPAGGQRPAPDQDQPAELGRDGSRGPRPRRGKAG